MMFKHTNLIILRLTRDCNLSCSYCFMGDKKKGERISFDVFRLIIFEIIRQRLSHKKQNEKLTLVFHGGESFILGAHYLEKLFDFANCSFKSAKMKFQLSVQTNMTLLDDEIAALLRKYNINVGVSYDGPGSCNDGRVLNSSNLFESKFDLLDKYGINYSILAVINRENVYKMQEAIAFFEKKGKYQLNYVEKKGEEISGRNLYDIVWRPLLESFVSGFKMNERNAMQYINSGLSSILFELDETAVTGCGSKFCGAGMRMVAVEPDGKVNHCDRFSIPPKSAFIQYAFDNDFLSLNQLKRAVDFTSMRIGLIKEAGCDTCLADPICDHGCSAMYYSKHGEYGIEKNIVCGLFINIMVFIRANFEDFVKQFEVREKNIISQHRIKKIKEYYINYFNFLGYDLILENNYEVMVVKK